jgi:hypothetical protein
LNPFELAGARSPSQAGQDKPDFPGAPAKRPVIESTEFVDITILTEMHFLSGNHDFPVHNDKEPVMKNSTYFCLAVFLACSIHA